jgi:alpha-tubulin suppressor-like RCC1 family protein
MKIDHLNDFFVKDVAIGQCVIHAICEHKSTGRIKLFGWGSNINGQLGSHDLEMIKHEPYDMTYLFIDQKSIEESDVIFDEDDIL